LFAFILKRVSAVGCQTINTDLNASFSTSTQEVGSQTVVQRNSNSYNNQNEFNLSTSTSPLNFDSLYNSQETQTIIHNLNANMTTQEVGSQTIYYNSNINSFETNLLAPPPPPPPSPLPLVSNNQKTISTSFQTEDFPCLDAGTSTYLDMYLSDISTQTQLTSSQSVQFNIEQNLVENFYYFNEPHNDHQNSYCQANLAQAKSFRDVSTNSEHHNSNYNDRESMTTPTNSSIFSNSTCQTENFYFDNNMNTNSIQTQTTSNFYINCNNQVVNMNTQTELIN
jgi:hypothetical protein